VVVAVVAMGALQPVGEPAIRNPLLNPRGGLRRGTPPVAHCVPLADSTGMAKGLDLHHYGWLGAVQAVKFS
jgi:hypothetical protein